MQIKKLDKRFKTYGTYQYVIYASDYLEWSKIDKIMENMGWRGTMLQSTTRQFKRRYAYSLSRMAFHVYEKDLILIQLAL